jgi:alkylation response protein AidB-like acyl-CoA dehydrogenase
MTSLDASEAEIVQAAEQFAAESLAPFAEDWERSGVVPDRALHRAAAKAGLTLLMTEQPHGHGRVRFPVAGRVAETLADAFMPFALVLLAHNYVAWALRDSSSDAIRAKYLPSMRAGEAIGVFCLTEPQGGSDAANIQSRARRVGNQWVLDGEKAWIMRAESADFYGVYAQTEPGSGARGMAMFAVDAAAPGVERFGFDLFAGRAFGMGGFRLHEVSVDANALLVPPGEGLRVALGAIDVARATVASMCCGLLRSGIVEAVGYTKAREAFGQRIADFQGIQWMLADAETDLEAARALADRSLEALEAKRHGSVLAAHAKKFASRVALTRLADCMQVMGANGAKSETRSSRHLGYAKLAQYLDGATEIQNVVISRNLFRDGGGSGL